MFPETSSRLKENADARLYRNKAGKQIRSHWELHAFAIHQQGPKQKRTELKTSPADQVNQRVSGWKSRAQGRVVQETSPIDIGYSDWHLGNPFAKVGRTVICKNGNMGNQKTVPKKNRHIAAACADDRRHFSGGKSGTFHRPGGGIDFYRNSRDATQRAVSSNRHVQHRRRAGT